ncbi:hypothetical protein [Piscinibacter terrae]|uniref:Uncharacterized protein n=1 Tax=Piscinibacter terrae TaxID=2496871 RepID=A0A3N7HWN8_9BURK|nr:hypothetical protein [Albitalea terrae]RQP26293.1 hypothetical protein DZC73_04490 [Albitalea terrae]
MKLLPRLLVPSLLCLLHSVSLAGAAGNPEVFIEGLTCSAGAHGLRMPATLPELMRLGRVQQESVQGVEQWEGYTATRKTVSFPGLVLGIVTFSNQADRYMLSSAEISAATWQKLSPYAVGQPVKAVRSVLGAASADDTELRSTYTGENDSIRFETVGGKVSKIVYQCYTG